MTMRLSRTLVLIAMLAAAGTALAHHSGAMFDRSKTITLKGKLKEYRFVAPHSWISVIATADGKGKEERWDVEGATASRMKAQGITPERLKVGDTVTLRIHPLRDGRKAGSLIDITLADGTKMTNNTTKLQVGQ
jgi:uncharacterized protein YfiM (DUF2279 family)